MIYVDPTLKSEIKSMQNLAQLLDFNCNKYGSYTQVIEGEKKISNLQVRSTAFAIAGWLTRNGIKHKSRVAICLETRSEAFSIWPAVWRANATVVSLHYKLGPDQITNILSSSKSEVFVTDIKRWNSLKEYFKKLTHIKVVLLDGNDETCIAYEELIQHKAEALPPQIGEPSDWALLLFSSGSTGTPKGIVQTHKMLTSLILVYNLAREAQNDPDYLVNFTIPCNVLFSSPLGHGVAGIIMCAGYAAGTTVVLQNGFEVEETLGLIEKHKINGFWAVPTILAAIVSHPDAKKYDLRSMKNWLTGGAPISHERIIAFEKAFPGRIIAGYGMVESTALVTWESMDQPHVPGSCGKALPGIELEIRSSTGQSLPHGETGEICIRSETISPGYLNLPEESARTFRDGWLHSGDLGHLDKDGNLFVSGRLKNMIIQGGTNIYPVTVEAAIESHPDIKECAVVGLKDSILGERVTAFVSLKLNSKLSSKELIEYCKSRLAAFEVPRQIVLLDSLPRNHATKIDILKLKNWTSPETDTGLAAELAAQTASERRRILADLVENEVAKALGVAISSLDYDLPLMRAGLSSLAAVELSIVLTEHLGKRVSETLIFNYPSLNKIIDHLAVLCSNTDEKVDLKSRRKGRQVGTGVAIIGSSCRLPRSISNLDELWSKLKDGVDCVSKVPSERWDADKYYSSDPFVAGKINQLDGGFVDKLGFFDPEFFDLTVSAAKTMDPQHRWALELAWEALEDSAIRHDDIVKFTTGVFLSISNYDFYNMVLSSGEFDPTAALGSHPAYMAGRISRFFNLNGPCLITDTTCSSSLVALHTACRAIMAGDCDLAFVGGMNAILSPQWSFYLSLLGVLSPDGRCKAFDDSANGMVRGEGGVILLVKELSAALKDGDRILGVVRGSMLSHDGLSANIGAPSGRAQVRLIEEALAAADIKPENVEYIEAHGTGTALGDAIELDAIREAYQANKSRSRPLFVGSVKTNVGHLESSAGLAGVLKILACFRNREIPPNLHYTVPNKKFDWVNSSMEVPRAITSWKSSELCASVSSFGFSGTIAHAILTSSPQSDWAEVISPQTDNERTHHILCVSAKSSTALMALVQKHRDHLLGSTSLSLASYCYTANTRRSHFEYRKAFIAADVQDMVTKLSDFLTDGEVEAAPSKPGKLAFLFSGQGGIYEGMGLNILRSSPKLRSAIARCDSVLLERIGENFESIVNQRDGIKGVMDVICTQPAVTTLQYGLAELWSAWGLSPTHVLGHSGGEFAAASIAKALDVEDAMKINIHRSRLMASLPKTGLMAACFTDRQTLVSVLGNSKNSVVIGALNGPSNFMISGIEAEVRAVVSQLETLGIKSRILASASNGVAFHSPAMDPILKSLEECAADFKSMQPTTKYVSSYYGRELHETEALDGKYWSGLTRSPVEYVSGLESLVNQGVKTFVEIGPHNILTGIGQFNYPDSKLTWLNSLQQNCDDWATVLSSLGTIYEKGFAIDWEKFDEDYKRSVVQIPIYPFDQVDVGLFPVSYDNNQWPTSSRGLPASVDSKAKLSGDITPPQQHFSKTKTPDQVRELFRSLFKSEFRISLTEGDVRTLRQIGVDSVKMIQLMMIIEKKIGVKLDAKFLLGDPTVAELEEVVAGADKSKIADGGWLKFWRPVLQSQVQLVCFHHLGGAASSFGSWPKYLSPEIDVLPIQLPGREDRINEVAYLEFDKLCADLVLFLPQILNKPFAFFGHSLGALVAYEVAERLERLKSLKVGHLFLSGSWAPSQVQRSLKKYPSFSELIGSNSGEVTMSPDFAEIVQNRARSDYKLLSSFKQGLKPKLNCPITVLAGEGDPLVPIELARQWEDIAGGTYEMQTFPGGHMFPFENEKLVAELVKERLLSRNGKIAYSGF